MPEKKLTPEEIRKLLTEPIDVEALLDYQFEYYVWFRGHSHRMDYQRHENIDDVIGRFIIESGAGEAGDQDKVYVFREFELWLTMQIARWDDTGLREFKVRNHWLNADESLSFQFGDDDEPESFET